MMKLNDICFIKESKILWRNKYETENSCGTRKQINRKEIN